jgi:hypothetical protein
MSISNKQILWAGIVVGAIVYFFLGTFTELAQSVQLGIYVTVGFVLPAIVVRAELLDDLPDA